MNRRQYGSGPDGGVLGVIDNERTCCAFDSKSLGEEFEMLTLLIGGNGRDRSVAI